jgi:hypothetical protein
VRPPFLQIKALRNFLFRDTLVTSLQTAISINETLAPSSNYTIFAYDTVNAAKSKFVATKHCSTSGYISKDQVCQHDLFKNGNTEY